MAKAVQETVPQKKSTYLIADVAALTGVSAPRLRSWEGAGVLQPLRSPGATRLYSVDDMARVRLITRSLLKPGRRGSLRRVAKDLASGALVPGPEDYAGLPGTDAPDLMNDTEYWHAVVASMTELVVVGDSEGRATSMNPALRALLRFEPGATEDPEPARSLEGEPLPSALETLPLRWSALTGTQHRDLMLALPGPAGTQVQTCWTVTPLRGADGPAVGAVAVGHVVIPDASLLPEDWLTLAAHGLRNPVTTILGRLQLARQASATLIAGDQAGAQKIETHLAAAERSTENLIRVMETVLDASAATKGVLIHHLEPDSVDLALLARQAIAHDQQQTSRHTVTLEAPPGPLLVAGDRIRLRQVLDHLLANAITYSPEGGAIEVRLEAAKTPFVLPSGGDGAPFDPSDAAAGWARLRVTDTGMGISSAVLPHVFDRYWRASHMEQTIGGAGLGLYVCRAVVAAHGGHIWVERTVCAGEANDAADGWHGTVMAVVLPLVEAPEHGDRTAKADDADTDDRAPAERSAAAVS